MILGFRNTFEVFFSVSVSFVVSYVQGEWSNTFVMVMPAARFRTRCCLQTRKERKHHLTEHATMQRNVFSCYTNCVIYRIHFVIANPFVGLEHRQGIDQHRMEPNSVTAIISATDVMFYFRTVDTPTARCLQTFPLCPSNSVLLQARQPSR